MTSMFAELWPFELAGRPEVAARMDRPGEVLAGWGVAIALLLVLAVA